MSGEDLERPDAQATTDAKPPFDAGATADAPPATDAGATADAPRSSGEAVIRGSRLRMAGAIGLNVIDGILAIGAGVLVVLVHDGKFWLAIPYLLDEAWGADRVGGHADRRDGYPHRCGGPGLPRAGRAHQAAVAAAGRGHRRRRRDARGLRGRL